jgi:hypothetical protein
LSGGGGGGLGGGGAAARRANAKAKAKAKAKANGKVPGKRCYRSDRFAESLRIVCWAGRGMSILAGLGRVAEQGAAQFRDLYQAHSGSKKKGGDTKRSGGGGPDSRGGRTDHIVMCESRGDGRAPICDAAEALLLAALAVTLRPFLRFLTPLPAPFRSVPGARCASQARMAGAAALVDMRSRCSMPPAELR